MGDPKMQLVDWLDDLSVRFIVNLPKEELQSVERICFQVEEAQWFYEDFVRPMNPQLPSMNLKQFCLAIFNHCPLFAGYDVNIYLQAFQEFLTYKSRVPVRGAIMLNDTMDEVVLVRGWKKGANWSFPRGKINKAEDDLDCAIREVFEETGLDVHAAGLIPEDRDVKSIDITLREQSIKLYVIPNVSKDTHFQPQTRKEIGSIQWYKLADLPTLKRMKQQQQNHEGHGENLASHANKFYMVAPFLGPLRRIISQLRKTNVDRQAAAHSAQEPFYDQFGSSSAVPFFNASSAVAPPQSLQSPDPGDMARLLTQLRQSKEAHRDQNLPEVSRPTELGPDGLPVQDPQPVATLVGVNEPDTFFQQHQQHFSHHSPFPQIQQPQAIDPAIDYQGRFYSPANAQPGFGAPHTPISHVNFQPQMPPSPTHQHRPHIARADSTISPPPVFQYLSGVAHPVVQGQPLQANQVNQTSGGPQVQPLWLGPGSSGAVVQQRSPAPYQQTGDFSLHSHPQDHSAASAPEPSRLPAPKLTANSAKLLSLFKAPELPADSAAAEMSAEHSRGPSNSNNANSSMDFLLSVHNKPPGTAGQLSVTGGRAHSPALASPTELGASSPVVSRPRTSQQNALLDLFKSQPGRNLGTLSPALHPGPSSNAPPAELSAAQSPAPTYSQFHERRTGSSEALAPPNAHSKVSIQKRHRGNQSVSNSMSATVTGPLIVSEQELQQRSAEARGRGSSTSLNKPGGQPVLTPGSVRILSRPGTSNGQKILESPKQSSPKPSRSPRRPKHEHKVSNPISNPSPKTFQPQILKRPVEQSTEVVAKQVLSSPQPIAPTPMTILRRGMDHPSPTSSPAIPLRGTPTIDRGIVEAPSPMSRKTSTTEEMIPVSAVSPGPPPGPHQFFDRRTSQTSEQKANLLSLFGKSSSSAAPTPPPLNVTSSPNPMPVAPGSSKTITPSAAVAAAATIQPAISPLSGVHQRNRMGSMVSVGSGDSLTGRQTPQTTSEKDRKFLLGFLNNVAGGK